MSEDPEKTRLDRKPIDLTGLEDDQSWRQPPGCSDEPLVLSPKERAQLVSCLDQGAEARRADKDHGANPYLCAPVTAQARLPGKIA